MGETMIGLANAELDCAIAAGIMVSMPLAGRTGSGSTAMNKLR